MCFLAKWLVATQFYSQTGFTLTYCFFLHCEAIRSSYFHLFDQKQDKDFKSTPKS